MFEPKIPKSDTGFEISVKIHIGIRNLYAFLTLFSAGTAICENSVFQKSGGLAFLTTSLCNQPVEPDYCPCEITENSINCYFKPAFIQVQIECVSTETV